MVETRGPESSGRMCGQVGFKTDAAPQRSRLARQGKIMTELPKSLKNIDARKSYAHFDKRISLRSCLDKVSNPGFVEKYSFYPVIQKDQRRMKWEGGRCESKPRPICYAAHMDRCIYQYYGALLNDRYNDLALARGIDDASIAYRTNHPGMSNCEYAEKAFSRMRQYEECFVCTGDFRSFFETLDHRCLKRNMRQLFSDGMIPDDFYHVLKASTRYSVCDIRDLLAYHQLPFSRAGVDRLNRRNRILEPLELRQQANRLFKSPWKENGGQGIPQGLPLSGVLANIYMIDFDKVMADAAKSADGLYMRYSDDFILVAPSSEGLQTLLQTLREQVLQLPTLTLHPKKTKLYHCSEGSVKRLSEDFSLAEKGNDAIKYLGFTFNGREVRLRQSTIGRFYRKTYKRVKKAFRYERPSKKRVNQLHIDTSDWGRYPKRNSRIRARCEREKGRGNFLSYANHAAKVFPGDPILRDTRRHKRKIRARSKRARTS